MTATYHIHLPAFLPLGPIDPKSGERTFAIQPPGELVYAGEPNPMWVPLNEEAVAAQRAMLEKSIARQEETIKNLDVGCKTKGIHLQKLAATKRHLAELKVSEAPESRMSGMPTAQELETMNAMQKSTPLMPVSQKQGPRR